MKVALLEASRGRCAGHRRPLPPPASLLPAPFHVLHLPETPQNAFSAALLKDTASGSFLRAFSVTSDKELMVITFPETEREIAMF